MTSTSNVTFCCGHATPSGGGQLRMLKLAPNFEMAMYLAQVTGAAIVTDCALRWNAETERAIADPDYSAELGPVRIAPR